MLGWIYLDCVLNESATVLSRRAREKKLNPAPVLRRLRSAIPQEFIDWTGPELPRLWSRVLDIMEETQGSLSFTDSLIIVVAVETGAVRIASFDNNFDEVAAIKRISSAKDC